MFEQFWVLYPRKVAKKVAEKAFNRLKKSEQALALEKLPDHLKYWQLKETEKEYIPLPATWLNQYRFEDELDLEPKKEKRPEMPWFSTEELTMAKGAEIGVRPLPGESMQEYRQRINYKLRELA